jgi:threonine aldolase
VIDLYSDTQTRPTAAMRAAMAAAEVGDEQLGEDPTVNRLDERVAELLGKERAVFMPSGTMCNLASAAVACRPGDVVLTSRSAHVLGSETGGLSAVAGAMPRAIPCERGIFTGEAVRAAVGPKKRNAPDTRVVWVENTVNRCGGAVWPLAALGEVWAAARETGLHAHVDGARILNAAIALRVPPARLAEGFDSVWIDLSKGLGCPVGAVLAGSAPFVEEAWRWKQRLGGAMRQAGVAAAAGLHALDHHVDRLAEDHGNARLLADAVRRAPGCRLAFEEVDTNMVFVDVTVPGVSAEAVRDRLLARGVRVGASGPSRLRAVTHLDVSRVQVETAGALLEEVMAELSARAA